MLKNQNELKEKNFGVVISHLSPKRNDKLIKSEKNVYFCNAKFCRNNFIEQLIL